MPIQRPLSVISLIFTALYLYLYLNSPAMALLDSTRSSDTDFIRTNCNVTLYPDICYTSLSPYASAVQKSSRHLAMVAIAVSLDKVRQLAVHLSNVTHEAQNGAKVSKRAAAALHDCRSTLHDAEYETVHSLKQMRHIGDAGGDNEKFKFLMSNVQTWMSAALTDEETCTDGFEDVPDEPIKNDVYGRVDSVKKLTSNALALVNLYASRGATPEPTKPYER